MSIPTFPVLGEHFEDYKEFRELEAEREALRVKDARLRDEAEEYRIKLLEANGVIEPTAPGEVLRLSGLSAAHIDLRVCVNELIKAPLLSNKEFVAHGDCIWLESNINGRLTSILPHPAVTPEGDGSYTFNGQWARFDRDGLFLYARANRIINRSQRVLGLRTSVPDPEQVVRVQRAA